MEPTAVKLVAQSTQMAAAAHAPFVRRTAGEWDDTLSRAKRQSVADQLVLEQRVGGLGGGRSSLESIRRSR